MTQPRRAWSLVGVLFATLVLVAGSGYGTLGVFFVPLVKQFGWTHTRVSLLSSVGATLGPLVAGRIFDATGAYKPAFELLAVMLVCGAGAVLLCRPLAMEQSRLAGAAFSLKRKPERAD